ncbi:MAG: M6 family metalloprotease domain-containing protein [Chitinivibrionales bacterium]|nr:M6 family metalloprotease domain-containing protein [Chitinivibrionales bacterium]
MFIKNMNLRYRILWLVMTVCVALLSAAPYNGEYLELKQPDGSIVPVLVYGDEYYQRIEDLDGYTLTRDMKGRICYAALSSDQQSLVATDLVYSTAGNPTLRRSLANSAKHLEIAPEARQHAAQALFNKLRGSTRAARRVPVGAVKGEITGLTLLIDFSDEKATIPQSEMDSMFNQKNGYSNFGNRGSVRQYFRDVSSGLLDYKNSVVGYYKAKKPKAYYDDTTNLMISMAKVNELLSEVLLWARDSVRIDFSKISVDDSSVVKAVNIMYAGYPSQGWAHGLWPHSSGLEIPFQTNSGKTKIIWYEMTNIGTDISIGVLCHENGHLICNYPDLYDYQHDSKGVGFYCLMCATDKKSPQPPCAPLRHLSGWFDPIDLTAVTPNTKYSIGANSNQVYVYKNKNDKDELFYIEAKTKKGYNSTIPSEGLFIWHTDWNMLRANNDWQMMKPDSHYIVSMEQADNRFDMERCKNLGDKGDAYCASTQSRFNDFTAPSSRWWKDSLSGLFLSEISIAADSMSFVTGQGSLSIYAPQSGDTLYSGDSVAILWNSSSPQTQLVSIDFMNASGLVTIIKGYDNSGIFRWKVPSMRSSTCQIRITDEKNGFTQTTGQFTITQRPLIQVTPGAVEAVMTIGQERKFKVSIGNTGDGVLRFLAEVQQPTRGVYINELYPSNEFFRFPQNGFELFNSGTDIALSGWRVQWKDNIGSTNSFSFPDGYSLKTYQCAVLSRMQFAPNDSLFFILLDWHRLKNLNFSIALYNAAGVCVDFIKTKGNQEVTPAGIVWNGPSVQIDNPKRWPTVYRNSSQNTFSADDWSYDTAVTPFAINPGQVVNMCPIPHWLALDSITGVIDSSRSKEITVTLRSASMKPGVYEDTIMIVHNGKTLPNPLAIPVRMTVEGITSMTKNIQTERLAFHAGPNPLQESMNGQIFFTYNKKAVKKATVTVYDCIGNTVAVIPLTGHASWNLRDSRSKIVAVGSYYAICRALLEDGTRAVATTMIGIKQ